MKKVFLNLPIAEAVSRVEASERSARRWSMSALAVAALLWVWARTPSFDLFPALASIVFRIATFLSYGLFPPVGSFVSGASQYFNLGYAIIFGPLIVLFLAWTWHDREMRALQQRSWVAQHPSLRRPVPRHLLFRELSSERVRRIPGMALKGAILVGACVTLLVRYTDLRASPDLSGTNLSQDEYCKRAKIKGCRCNDMWVDPWPGAEKRISWWWPPAAWCVGGGSGELRNFKSVLPTRFLEEQQKDGDATRIKVHAEKLSATLGIEVEGRGPQFDLLESRRPYDTFPYIYPALTMWLNTMLVVMVLGLWLRLWWMFLPVGVGREHWPLLYRLGRLARRRLRRTRSGKPGNTEGAANAEHTMRPPRYHVDARE